MVKMPDATAVAALNMAINSGGAFHTSATPLLTPERSIAPPSSRRASVTGRRKPSRTDSDKPDVTYVTPLLSETRRSVRRGLSRDSRLTVG